MPGAKTKKKIIDRRPVLDQRKKETMLMVLIRNESAHTAVRQLLKPPHLRSMGDCYAVLWRVVCEFFARQNRLPAHELIMDDVQNLLSDRPDDLDPSEIIELETFLEVAFDDTTRGCQLDKSRMHRDEAVHTAKLFLEEALAADLAETVAAGASTPVDLPKLLQTVHAELTTVAGITQANAANDQVFSPGWDTQERAPLREIGISILDRFLGGGDGAGEVEVFMGPTGSCKSIIACQGASRAAKQANMLYRQGYTNGRIPKVVFVTTEILLPDFRIRLLANMADIPRERLERMRSLNDLCRDPEPCASPDTNYETVFLRSGVAPESFMCEYDRVRTAVSIINRHLIFVDFTGSDPSMRGVGCGGIPELAGTVEAKLAQYNGEAYPHTFWIDHAAALASRMMLAGTYEPSELRGVLKAMPLQCRDYLSVPYNTATWIMHQLSGEANSRGPTVDIDHTDADECRTFAYYADFAVVTGRPTEIEQLCRIRCTKHRRQPSRSHAIGRIDGRFMRVKDVSNSCVVDGRAIRHTSDMVAVPQAPRQRSAQQANRSHMW